MGVLKANGTAIRIREAGHIGVGSIQSEGGVTLHARNVAWVRGNIVGGVLCIVAGDSLSSKAETQAACLVAIEGETCSSGRIRKGHVIREWCTGVPVIPPLM